MSLNKRHYSDSSIHSNLHVIDTPPSPAEVHLTRKQLALEIKLQQSSHDLLLLYQESQNWVAVSEVAQTLNTNSKRVEQLKNQLLSLENGSVVSHPPLLKTIREAESPIDSNPTVAGQQRAESPVESVTDKQGQTDDNTEEHTNKVTIKQEEEKDKGLKEKDSSSCCDREEVKGEGVEQIISLNHTDPEGTPKNSKDSECPSKLEEDTEVFDVQQVPTNAENTTTVDIADSPVCENSTEQTPTEELPPPVQPVSNKQLNPLLVQDLQDQPATEQPVVDDLLLDTFEQPPSIELSNKPTTTDDIPKPLIIEEDLEEPVTDTQVDQSPTEETEGQEPLRTEPEEPPVSDRSATVTPVQPVLVDSSDQSDLLGEPVIGEATTVEESLEKLAALVGDIQIDLDITEESLGDVPLDSNKEANPLKQETEEGKKLPEEHVINHLSRESSVEFEDAVNDDQVSVESSDDTSDSFFSPPESLGPSDNIHPHSDRSTEDSDPPKDDSIQHQPQSECETVSGAENEEDSPTEQTPQVTTASVSFFDSQTKEEEDPVTVSNQDTATDKQEKDPVAVDSEPQDTASIVSPNEEGDPVIVSNQDTADYTQEEDRVTVSNQDTADYTQEENPVTVSNQDTADYTQEEDPVTVSSQDTAVDKLEEDQDTTADKQEEDPGNQLSDDLPTTDNTIVSAPTTENTTTAPVPEEAVPVIATNQNTSDITQDTEQEDYQGDQVLSTAESTVESVTTVVNTTTESVSVVPDEEVPEKIPNQENSDSGAGIDLNCTTVPIVATLVSTEEDTPVIISNLTSNQSDEPPATSVHSSTTTSPPSKIEETPDITSANSEEEDSATKQRMSEIAFTVNKFTNPSDSAMFYRIDIRSFDVLFNDPELLQHLPVLHSLEDFLKLRQRLESIAKERESEVDIPQLIPQCNHVETSMKNGNGVDEECEQFEKFLNQVVNDPKLGKEQVLVQFLSGREPSLSPPPPEESPPTETPEVLVNGDTEDHSTLSPRPMDSQPDKDISSSTTEQTLNDTPSAPPNNGEAKTISNEGEVPVVIKTDAGGTQSDRDELTFSPNHSERTSSSATNSSNIATDESAPELCEVGANKQENVKLSRSESNPVLGEYELSLDGGNTLHQSLVPSQFKYASSDNILERSVVDLGDDSGDNKLRYKRSTMKDRIRKQGKRIARRVGSKKRSATFRNPPPDMENDACVTVRRPITSQEWDPTCLLEELYSDYKQGTTMTDVSGESARHFGYLEKLPTGQSKASLLKGWKRRYFRAQEGNVYYYDDRTQGKALGFVRLSTARIILIPEKNQIQIVEKGSKNSIMLKAPDSQELLAWHRALELEAVHPTQPAPQSPLFKIENPILIVDIGACSVRAGLSRENAYPEVFFPAVCSLDARSLDILDCGYNALLPQNRYGAHQIYPRKTSLRMDKHDTSLKTKAIDGIMTNILERLDVDPQTTQVLLTHPPTVPEQDRNELAELLLDAFMFDGVCFQEQAVLALYSYNTTSGIIVDIGDHIDVVPFIDGYKIEAGISRMVFGGNAVTEYLSKLITLKGIRYFSETEVYINRMIMESLCYVSQDYNHDAAECDANPVEFTRAVDVDRFQLPDHRKVIALDSALFKAPEGFFRPDLWGKDIPSLPELVWKAIQACPIDQRREMAKRIYLSGATTLLPGLQERLQKELGALTPGGLTIEVHAAPTRHHAAYLGASVLAGLSSFQSYLVTQDEWSLEGIDALRKWGGT